MAVLGQLLSLREGAAGFQSSLGEHPESTRRASAFIPPPSLTPKRQRLLRDPRLRTQVVPVICCNVDPVLSVYFASQNKTALLWKPQTPGHPGPCTWQPIQGEIMAFVAIYWMLMFSRFYPQGPN